MVPATIPYRSAPLNCAPSIIYSTPWDAVSRRAGGRERSHWGSHSDTGTASSAGSSTESASSSAPRPRERPGRHAKQAGWDGACLGWNSEVVSLKTAEKPQARHHSRSALQGAERQTLEDLKGKSVC